MSFKLFKNNIIKCPIRFEFNYCTRIKNIITEKTKNIHFKFNFPKKSKLKKNIHNFDKDSNKLIDSNINLISNVYINNTITIISNTIINKNLVEKIHSSDSEEEIDPDNYLSDYEII